jgi:chromosome segregation ATPase
MKLVIATGCPYTDWEMVVPTLMGAGLKPAADAFSGWQEQLLVASGMEDLLQFRQPLQPDASMAERLALLLSDNNSAADRLVVNRCPWLLDFWATRYPDMRFLLFFTCAETALAQALVCGIEPRQFVADWKANTHHLIRFQRRYRQRALLLSAEAANQYPDALIGAASLIGLSLQVDTGSASRETPAFPEMERFLAHRLVADDPSISALQVELDARSQPLGDLPAQTSGVVLDKLLECYLRTREDHQQLRTQLHAVQEELEKVFLAKQQLERTEKARGAELQQLQIRMAQVEQTREKLEATNQSLQAGKKEALEENDLLLRQLHDTQEEYEKAFLAKQQIEQAEKARGAELQQLQARMAQVEQTRKKLEATNQSLQAGKKEALEENQLLLRQLLEVKEQLEKAFLAKQQIEQAEKARGAELQQLQARMAQVEQTRKKLEATNQSLQAGKKEALEENQLLLRQLLEVKEQLEKAFLAKQQIEQAEKARDAELQQLQARMAQVEQTRKKLEATNQSLQAGKKEALEENQLLLRQLLEVKEQLEQAFLAKQQIEQAEKAKGLELQQLQARMAQVEQTREKLEATNQSLQAGNKEALEENELLLKQLHQVQEELEHYFLKYQETLNRETPVPEAKAAALGEIPGLDVGRQLLVQSKQPTAWTRHALIRALAKPFKRPDRKKEKIRRQAEVLNQSGLFDQQWYLSRYPDVAAAGVDPTEHYLQFGAAEGRNPSAKFDTVYYLQSNPDVAAAGVNPLLHYIQFGIAEGRQICG